MEVKVKTFGALGAGGCRPGDSAAFPGVDMCNGHGTREQSHPICRNDDRAGVIMEIQTSNHRYRYLGIYSDTDRRLGFVTTGFAQRETA